MDPKALVQVWNKLSQIGKLPTLPEVYMRVRKALEDPDITAQKIGNIILMDQGLTASVLRLANSAHFGFRRQVSSIKQAIMLLGFNAIRDFVLSVSLMGIFPARDDPESPFQQRSYWEHSIAVAVGSRIIAEDLGYNAPETVFVGGLIHDIGRLILNIIDPDAFKKTLIGAAEEKIFVFDAEVRAFGFSHNEVGHVLAEMWHLPEQLDACIAYHHSPAKVINQELVQPVIIVHVADCLAKALSLGSSGDSLVPPIDEASCEKLRIAPAFLPQIMRRLEDEYPHARDSILSAIVGK